MRELQVEVMEFGDIRAVDPEVILVTDPVAETVALHGVVANLKGNFGQDLFRQLEEGFRIRSAW